MTQQRNDMSTKHQKRRDDVLLQSMLNQSQFSRGYDEDENNGPNNYWFSYKEQKKRIFEVATLLFTYNEVSPSEAIDEAKEFVDVFFQEVIRHK